MENLDKLANLINQRNLIDTQISKIIQRPATQGHIGEFIASKIFEIKLAPTANHKAIDGWFLTGALAQKTVNVKFYGKQDGLLAIQDGNQPDYFLVLTGPIIPAGSSKGTIRSCVIDYVYLFDGHGLAEHLQNNGKKFGVAASVGKKYWEEAEIYPKQKNRILLVSEKQKQMISLFQSKS